MEEAKVLDNTARCMQRLGYLKHLAARCAATETSNFRSLGVGLIQAVSRDTLIPLNEHVIEYVRRRLTDRTYHDIRKQLFNKKLPEQPPEALRLEIQDVYLSSPDLPSRTGKLIPEDWRRYPLFAIGLGFIRRGTYSALVRSLVLLSLTPVEQQEAFREYRPEANPFRTDAKQALLFLYCLLENDGEVLKRLYPRLLQLESQTFSDREAGDLLPGIYRQIVQQSRKRGAISGEERERLEKLLKIADSIEKWRGKTYTGSGANIETITVRLEPFVDLRILTKADPYKYEYQFITQGLTFFSQVGPETQISEFLSNGFFRTCASAFHPGATHINTTGQIIALLFQATQDLKSPLGYAPITDVALLAGIRSLVDENAYFEIAEATQILRSFQKAAPHLVRFNVDRLGNLAYVKFLGPPETINVSEFADAKP